MGGAGAGLQIKQEERIHGVLPYIAPELFQKTPYTKASDIYSFGIIMVEMTTGKRLLQVETQKWGWAGFT
ncbi:hypothetical protein C2G38_2209247 [Gigaspora rosea]|uniref:Protein kinase domain-containing protein n=1 Tax=Gigaspora rosea TaxID=44941 RepID=A0A397UQ93_9GLOM|nr:hypothetical protein C2G38_2209247 [Gigaspora rosea]